MTAVPTVEYRFYIEDDIWLPLHELTAEDLLEHWLAQDHLTCCSILGGFLFFADGEPWNADALDEVWMSTSWPEGVSRLLEGHSTAQVWAWEESCMTLVRRRDRVEMFDVHHSGNIVCPRVIFPLVEVARGLAAEVESLAEFMDRLLSIARERATPEQLSVIEDNLSYSWRQAAAKLRDLLGRPIPQTPNDNPGPPPAIHLAIRLDNRQDFAQALADEGAEVEYDGHRPLHVAIRLGRGWAVEALLEAGADPNTVGQHGMTALLFACQKGNLDFVQRLLDADPSSRGTYDHTLLQQVALGIIYHDGAMGDIERTRRLADQAPRFPDILGLWVQRLRQETYDGRVTVVERVNDWKPAMDALRAAGVQPDPSLHEAVLSGDMALVESVLAMGADPRYVVREQSALEVAEHYGLEAIAARLREAL